MKHGSNNGAGTWPVADVFSWVMKPKHLPNTRPSLWPEAFTVASLVTRTQLWTRTYMEVPWGISGKAYVFLIKVEAKAEIIISPASCLWLKIQGLQQGQPTSDLEREVRGNQGGLPLIFLEMLIQSQQSLETFWFGEKQTSTCLIHPKSIVSCLVPSKNIPNGASS